MQGRKRLNAHFKSNTDSFRGNVIHCIDGTIDNDILPKYFKFEQSDYNQQSYFATPGECTRSKTTKIKINPFDLSNPEPKDIIFDNFISSSRRNTNARSKYRFSEIQCEHFFCENSRDSGFDTESISESILSFATRSSDDNSRSSFSSVPDIKWPENSESSLSKLKPKSSPVNNCSETGYLLPIVSDSSHNVLIPQISSLTLANILSGNHTLDNNITIFDCRFPYEYAGGHIANSINVYTSQQLLQTLFPVKESCSERRLEEEISNLIKKLKRDNTIYVFYCEYSSYRAPKMAQCLRGLDRLAHFGSRDLFIPNIYVLYGGYRDFFCDYSRFCFPNDYVSMKQTRYPLRNSEYITENKEISFEICKNQYRKEEKQYIREIQESEKKLRLIITKSTKDSDILQLFSSHPIIGGS